jgi:predicted secreted protein
MAKTAGRLFVLKKGVTVIGGGRSLSVSVNGSPIDVSDKDSAGFVEYLADELTGRQLEFTVDGIEEDQVLRDLAFGASSGVFLSDLTFEFGATSTVSGDFVMTGYSETGEYQDSITYTATFVSDGSWTYT